LIKLLLYIFEKYVNVLALAKASPGNRRCASYIGALSFPADILGRASSLKVPDLDTERQPVD